MVDPSKPLCPRCRTPNDVDAVYCGVCGRELGSGVPQPEPRPSRAGGGAPPLMGTRLGMPVIGAAEGPSQPAARDQGFLPRNKVSTSPGFSDPTMDAVRGLDPGAALRGRAALGGPTLLDAPAGPPPEAGPEAPAEAGPKGRAAATATLMSQSPLRGVFAEFGGTKAGPERSEVGAQTILDPPREPAPPAASPEPPVEAPARPPLGEPTVLDQPAIAPPPAPAPPASDALPPLSSEARALLERFAGSGGMPRAAPAPAKPSAPASAPAASPTPLPSSAGATILGIPVPPGVKREDEPAGPAAPPSSRPVILAGGAVLGVPVQSVASAASVKVETAPPPGPGPGPAAGNTPPDVSGMTMFGLPSPARRPLPEREPAAPAAPAAPRPEPAAPRASVPGVGDDTASLQIARKGRGWALLIVALVVVVAAAIGASAVLLLSGGAYDITPEVTVGGDRVRVILGIAPAAKGAKVRFVGQEQPVVDGKATFDIRSQVLAVGTNKIPVEILDADGDRSTASVTFDVSYRAEADMSGLSQTPPYYSVSFHVMKGAVLEVASQPVQLDAEGRYLHKIPLDEATAGAVDAGDTVSHRLPFSVQLPGKAPVREVIDTAIPRTGLRVLAPADGLVVERDSIVCAGTTEPTAEVAINGAKVTATGGQFSHTVPLPGVGEHAVEVTATAPGKASRTVRLTVRREENLAPLIQAFAATVDASLTYEQVASDTDALRGRPVRFHGRVVAMETVGGQTLMQVLVDQGCAQEGRCSIHVTYRGQTDAQLYSRVTVYGTVSGRWQGQTQSGSQLVMPSIAARFIVPEPGTR